jgi:hypothetical protein
MLCCNAYMGKVRRLSDLECLDHKRKSDKPLLPLQVSLDGGKLDLATAGPFNAAAGRPLMRQQLLEALHSGTNSSSSSSSSGVGHPAGSAVAGAELSAGLQRLLLLAQAVGELQQPSSAAASSSSSRMAGAVQVLVQVSMDRKQDTGLWQHSVIFTKLLLCLVECKSAEP